MWHNWSVRGKCTWSSCMVNTPLCSMIKSHSSGQCSLTPSNRLLIVLLWRSLIVVCRSVSMRVGTSIHFALIYLMFLWLVKVGCLRLVISLYRCHTLESLLKNKNINNYLSQIVVVLLSLNDFTADNSVEKLLKCFPD